MREKGRFAPSPSGRMHLGNIAAFLLAWLEIRQQQGTMLLRMEDLDTQRTGEPWTSLLVEDLRWLGLDWEEGWAVGTDDQAYCQRHRQAIYDQAFARLQEKGLVYPCWCSRAKRLALSAPHRGEEREKGVCPCRHFTQREREEHSRTKAPAWKAAVPQRDIIFQDGNFGVQQFYLAQDCGDFILRRADGVYGYQLAVTVDDGLMGVTRVTRGVDLLDSTPWQLWLMEELGYYPPQYAHLPLLVGEDGKRLAKRDRYLDMGVLRQRYCPEEVVGYLAHAIGLIEERVPVSPKELSASFTWSRIGRQDFVVTAL